jgi:endonuclease-3
MARENFDEKKQRTAEIIRELKHLYPDAKCALNHLNAFELLIATILSAQTTDVRVNMVTPALFKRYPTAEALAKSEQADVEKMVQTTGFFRSKAKSIRATAADIVSKHGGKVPATMDELTQLRGVGRKTANVVLGNAFCQNVGVVVDTHVGRLSVRLGLTKQTDPVKVEQDLIKLVPQEDWTIFSHLLIFHGRQVCMARSPKCEQCAVLKLCPTGPKLIAATVSAAKKK